MGVVTIIVEDKVGLLLDMSYMFEKAGVGVNELFLDVMGPKLVISVEAKDPEKLSLVLEENGFECVYSLEPEIGELHEGKRQRICELTSFAKA